MRKKLPTMVAGLAVLTGSAALNAQDDMTLSGVTRRRKLEER